MEKSTVVKQGMGFFGWLAVLLTVVFVVLKLVGTIAWSWWLVFLPLIIYVALDILAIIVLIIVTIIVCKWDRY